ncbi:RNA polymerase II subunit B1 CTD phosphatase Rpap2 [Elysia marginata]|uniref:RNA polymerase II subunit B1 CTD phosphatase RPAP2 homolog n=1 Tax=Elysia marginata TaxID=1093978 RepID=A0AAV4IYX0_9GAST|nr:RNA polymerase II subunit B1 CTD phosphatase Rpap2 [Elysia marginata]
MGLYNINLLFFPSIDINSKKLENIERTVRTRVECEERAFRIVNKLIDGYVAGAYLVECGRLISKEHYNDIVEERAISRLCGYPVCSNILGKTPNKKYHVSTKTNKVYEISERKNFCSNQCFKASRHFLAQIPDSPLWMRDKEQLPTINLLEHDSIKGIVGDEVIGSNPKQILKDELDSLEDLDKKTSTSKKISSVSKSRPAAFMSSDSRNVSVQRETDIPLMRENTCDKSTRPVDGDNAVKTSQSVIVTENTPSDSTSMGEKNNSDTRKGGFKSISGSCESDLFLLGQKFDQLTTDSGPQNENQTLEKENVAAEELSVFSPSIESTKMHQVEHSESNRTIETPARENPSSKMDQLKALLSKRKNVLLKMADVQVVEHNQPANDVSLKNSQSPTTAADHLSSLSKKEEEPVGHKASNTTVYRLQPQVGNSNNTRYSAHASTENSSHEVKTSGKKSPLVHVCDILKTWMSPETFCYLSTNPNSETHSLLRFSDPHVQQGYGSLCHRLAAQEKQLEVLLGGSLDGDVETEKAFRPSKPVPDYKALQEETEAYTLNVMEFITGKKPTAQKKKDKSTTEDSTICLPTVDTYDQHQIRVRIVMDCLDKSLPDVLMPLSLCIQDVAGPVRELVQTCRSVYISRASCRIE